MAGTQLFWGAQWWDSAAPARPPDVLARRLAHELRNRLAPIATAAELLTHQAGDEGVRHLGGVIERHAAQLRHVIDELIAASQAGTGMVFGSGKWGGDDGGPEAAPACDRQLSLPLGEVTPRLGGVPVRGAPPAPDSLSPTMPALRILVVDDNADAAHLLGLFLKSLGHEVCVLTDPLAAVAAAAQFQPQIGLLDIAMPGLDGHGLARRLLQMPTSTELRLAAVTAYSQPSERQAAARAGFEQYFVKPLDVRALQAWLERLGLIAVA